jgi:hypothetical protein
VFAIDEVKEKMLKYFDVEIIEDFVPDEKILVIGRKK